MNTLATRICPKPIPGVGRAFDDLTGYGLWILGFLFGLGVLITIGAALTGWLAASHGATKIAIRSGATVLGAAIALPVLWGLVQLFRGAGCVG